MGVGRLSPQRVKEEEEGMDAGVPMQLDLVIFVCGHRRVYQSPEGFKFRHIS